MPDRKILLAWLLRLVGLLEVLAFIAVVMPRSWMEYSHEWLGMGRMPEGSVLMFLIRQASYTYGMHGLSLWVLSFDVRRFRPLIIFNAFSYLIAAPVFFIIDYVSGMPAWWAIEDPIGVGTTGILLFVLTRKNGESANYPKSSTPAESSGP
jgi:hypothetical protein